MTDSPVLGFWYLSSRTYFLREEQELGSHHAAVDVETHSSQVVRHSWDPRFGNRGLLIRSSRPPSTKQ